MNKLRSTTSLALLFGLTSFFIAVFWAQLAPQIPESAVKSIFDYSIVLIIFFLIGCLGAVFVQRKEVPHFGRVTKGNYAIFYGLLICISAWSVAFYALFLLIKVILF